MVYQSITILGLIHHLVFYLKHDVSEPGSCLRLQREPTQLGPIIRIILPPDGEITSSYVVQIYRAFDGRE
jgi:hypothetical protein